MLKPIMIAAGLAAAMSGHAQALCIYHGVDNAKTTLAQEFRDSHWVVRARVMSGDEHWSDEGESWARYRLKVVDTLKGPPLGRFTFFSYRNSGGFYMDGKDAVPDLGADYLLFLDRWRLGRKGPRAAQGAFFVNYNCGQSKPWADLTKAETESLKRLSQPH